MNATVVRPQADAHAQERAFLHDMLRIRLIEEEIATRYAEEKMRCPVHLSIGQEAVPVGVSAALRRDDQVVSTHRCHAHYLAKGGDLNFWVPSPLYGFVEIAHLMICHAMLDLAMGWRADGTEPVYAAVEKVR